MRPELGTIAGGGSRGDRLRDAEVGDDGVFALEQDVLGFHVAVHDPVLVREAERVEELAGDADGVGEREGPFAHESCSERLPGDERHRVPEQRVIAAGGEYGNDVRMLPLRDRLDLATEPLGAAKGGGFEVERLDDDVAVEGGVAGDEHPRHAAAPELAFEPEGVSEGCLKPLGEGVHCGSECMGRNASRYLLLPCHSERSAEGARGPANSGQIEESGRRLAYWLFAIRTHSFGDGLPS